MKAAIVTTTINPPTEALIRFAAMEDWKLYVVGDRKTPEDAYLNFPCHYMSPQEQESMYKDLSDIIGWDCVQRRSIGLVQAYKDGADIIATVDDDNIPYSFWGEDVVLGKTVRAIQYVTEAAVFDPIYYRKAPHRGFPLELLKIRSAEYMGFTDTVPLVRADLWHGAPDIDAVSRLMGIEDGPFSGDTDKYFSRTISPFNSQNTFLHRSVIPDYHLYPGIGRMDDIWAAYSLQKKHPGCVVYGPPSVYQKRNPHNVVDDLKAEMLGYEHTLDFINGTYELPDQAKQFVDIYQSYFK